MTESISFRKLVLDNWQQFASINIEFHPVLTVITGANGAGKTTILNLLARHLGASRPQFAIPQRGASGLITYMVGRLSVAGWWTRVLGPRDDIPQSPVGEISYSNNTSATITVPEKVSSSYQLNLSQQVNLDGIPIGSHRLLSGYQSVEGISFTGVAPEAAFPGLLNEARNRFQGRFTDRSIIGHVKQTLASWAVVGEGNSTVQGDERQKIAFDGFVSKLAAVLPATLGFQHIAVRPPEIVLVTESGEFILDAASGGITSIVELTALLYFATLTPAMSSGRFVVTIDEPENHLHPTLQRDLLPNLIRAFPGVQFIVTTHSPFMVSSVKDSSVYVLRYHTTPNGRSSTSKRRIVSEKLDYINRAGSASEMLREVLGLSSTLPQWVESDLRRIVSKYQEIPISDDSLQEMRSELRAAGLDELFPEALSGLAKS